MGWAGAMVIESMLSLLAFQDYSGVLQEAKSIGGVLLLVWLPTSLALALGSCLYATCNKWSFTPADAQKFSMGVACLMMSFALSFTLHSSILTQRTPAYMQAKFQTWSQLASQLGRGCGPFVGTMVFTGR